MGRNFTEFEKSVRDSLDGYEVPFNEAHWSELSQKMEGKKVSSATNIAAAIVTAIILAGSTIYVLSPDTAEIDVSGESTLVEIADSTVEENSSVNTSEEYELNLKEDSKKDQELITEQIPTSAESPQKTDSNKERIEPTSTVDYIKVAEDSGTKENLEEINIDSSNPINTEESNDLTEESELNDGELVPSIKTSIQEACVGEEINFFAENVKENENFLWNFGNGDFSTDLYPQRKFDEPGVYNVTLIISGGSSRKVKSEITIHPTPSAHFEAVVVEPGEVVLENQSQRADKSTWQLEDEFLSNEINPVLTYTEGGSKYFTLLVENEFGCTDIERKDVLLTSPFTFNELKNTLEQGESFAPKLNVPHDGSLSLEILNTKSQLIFENIGDSPSWNGTLPDGTYPSPKSEFVYLIKVLDKDGNELHSDSGQFVIIP